MTEPQALELLTLVFRDIFERHDIILNPLMTARDLVGWDSFRQVEIVMALEERLGVRFETSELDRLRNVGNFAELLVRKTGS